ncbi:MAG: 50S ribosomal protein L18 [Verrucomicrobia bacterium]|nr:50S ribosomal protein L18 [Verrucomicrobiota bacterium]MDA1085731.1 50S ribosomal protein L18 [Verrucomicrobiota bacterium]
MKLKSREDYRTRRHQRLRKKIEGTAERPRLAVMISNRHLYAQVIDDAKGCTLVAVSSLATDGGVTVEKAAELGTKLGELVREKGVQDVVFDRGGYQFHGRVKALADAARAAGLKF